MINVYRVQKKPDAGIFKFPIWVGIILLYVTYASVGVFALRSELNALPVGGQSIWGYLLDVQGSSVYAHWAIYFAAGIKGWIWFEILAWAFCSFVRMRFPHLEPSNLKHILRCFFVLRNVVLAAVYTVLFYFPLSIAWVTTAVNFVITTLAAAAFFAYYVPRNFPKFVYGHVLMLMGQMYLGYNLLQVVLLVTMGVML